jgi:hypothetical protein
MTSDGSAAAGGDDDTSRLLGDDVADFGVGKMARPNRRQVLGFR